VLTKLLFFFRGFFPAAINFLRRVPVLGTFLNLPGIKMVRPGIKILSSCGVPVVGDGPSIFASILLLIVCYDVFQLFPLAEDEAI